MITERLGHAVLAGAVGGSAIVCGAATGPLLAAAFDLAAAAATAGIAAHAVEVSARERGVSSAGVLHRAARGAIKSGDAPLAAHAVDVLCRARSGDARALRSAATLLGRVTSAHARGLAFQLFGSWCAPLRKLAQLGAPLGAARAALDNAEFVRAMASAAPETARWVPTVGMSLETTLGERLERADNDAYADVQDESSQQEQHLSQLSHLAQHQLEWEVAA